MGKPAYDYYEIKSATKTKIPTVTLIDKGNGETSVSYKIDEMITIIFEHGVWLYQDRGIHNVLYGETDGLSLADVKEWLGVYDQDDQCYHCLMRQFDKGFNKACKYHKIG